MVSSGNNKEMALATVKPPTPESKIPIGRHEAIKSLKIYKLAAVHLALTSALTSPAGSENNRID